MLDPLSVWAQTFNSLPYTADADEGAENFSVALGTLMDKVQAGPEGTEGIFTFDEPTFKEGLLTLQPVADNSWASNLADIWQTAVLASVIAPSTVTDSAWTSSETDVDTLPTPAATIPVISDARNVLETELLAVSDLFTNPDTSEDILLAAATQTAKAFRDATLTFTFICIGLVLAPPGPPVQLAITFPAQ